MLQRLARFLMQTAAPAGTAAPCAWRIDTARTLQLPASGWLQVLSGQAWITRRGDSSDLVLQAGQATAVRRGEALVLEPWQRGQPVQLRLLPCSPALTARPPACGSPGWPTIAR